MVLFNLDNDKSLAEKILDLSNLEKGAMELRNFPDGETYLRIYSDLHNKDVYILANLCNPNPKFLPLIYFADQAKNLGAKSVRLIAPYLAYMRQDKAFHDGEAVTSRTFARLVSEYFDELITIDPHLHRYKALSEIYSCQTKLLHANLIIGNWVKDNITKPLIIGPDSESRQWAEEIAKVCNAPFIVLQKTRHSDRNVSVSMPNLGSFKDSQPILVDDIISTGKTMIEATKAVFQQMPSANPILIGVHAVFAENAYQEMLELKNAKIITCNTIAHETNGIDVSGLIVSVL